MRVRDEVADFEAEFAWGKKRVTRKALCEIESESERGDRKKNCE